jgi:hypothetical protein
MRRGWLAVLELDRTEHRESFQPPRLSGLQAPESDPWLPRRLGGQPPAVSTGHQPHRSPFDRGRCRYEAQSVCDPGSRRPKTKYETGTTPAELTTVTTVAHSHFGPRTWLAGRRLRSTSAAILRTPSATAALTSNLRVRSPRSLHCLLAAMTSLHTARIPMPCTLPAAAGIYPVMLPTNSRSPRRAVVGREAACGIAAVRVAQDTQADRQGTRRVF